MLSVRGKCSEQTGTWHRNGPGPRAPSQVPCDSPAPRAPTLSRGLPQPSPSSVGHVTYSGACLLATDDQPSVVSLRQEPTRRLLVARPTGGGLVFTRLSRALQNGGLSPGPAPDPPRSLISLAWCLNIFLHNYFRKSCFQQSGREREKWRSVLGHSGTSGLWLVLPLNLGGELLSQLGLLPVRMLYANENVLLERNCFSEVTRTRYSNLFPSTPPR